VVIDMNVPNMKDAAVRFKTKPKYIYETRKDNHLYVDKLFYLRTYGCQMNVHDSEEIRAILFSLGFKETEDIKIADLIILNTCAIRENAHDKVFGFLGKCKHFKKKNKDLILALCGCMAQEEVVVDEILEKHLYIDLVFGTHNIGELPNLLEQFNHQQMINVYSKEGDVIEIDNHYARDSKVTAWVNIMYGCDKFCTYCIVPYTRGKERSRKAKDIIKEVKELVANGYKEITLLGQNVNAYGKDLDNECSFSELLSKVSDTGIERIRFVTSHPWDFTDEMIEIISSKNNIMPYIHLPIQSGSNRILKLMNRKYTREEYIDLVTKIRAQIPGVTITTDIIVAFPGETEEDFSDTLDIVKKLQFDGAFTFIFSPRVGTPAAKLKDELDEEEKRDRLKRLNLLVNKHSLESNEKFLGTKQKVLVTGLSEKNKDILSGYTENMKLVNVSGKTELISQIIDVEIKTAKSFSLDGNAL
jgi:tRNA-2-methylthio-N6-dimethylallyladenosine synthase